MYDPDVDYSTGVKLTKPKSALRAIDPYVFADCIAWLKLRVFSDIGYTLNETMFDPELGMWYLYEDGYLVLRLSHDTMERIWTQLQRRLE